MRIESTVISFQSKHSSVERHEEEESLRMWVGSQRPGFEGRQPVAERPPSGFLDVLELSDEARAIQARGESPPEAGSSGRPVVIEISERDKQKIMLLQRMIEALTGKKIKFYLPEKLELSGEKPCQNTGPAGPTASRQRQGWGLEYDYHRYHYEQEQLSFRSEGVIRTSDGREINFSVQLNMSREFASRLDLSVRAGDAAAVDPLVINFNGAAPALTETKYVFDLDADGSPDQISFLAPGSGFLAIDQDGDGVINNGKELFGPATGDGFAELARYDSDGNNWIDENDPVFERLRLWTKDSDGRDVLFALGEKGIGAIYLGSIQTPFAFKDSANLLQGQARATGLFVKENGLVGTMQQIDLKV